MKTRDLLIISLVVINVALAMVLFVRQGQMQPAQQQKAASQLSSLFAQKAHAGPVSTDAGYYRACTIRLSGNREGIAIIDTVTNRLLLFQRPAGRPNWDPPTSLNLARDFGHPRGL